MSIELADILAARRTIAGVAARTPMVPSLAVEGELLLKLETAQPIGAFKLRGALNAVAAVPAGAPGVRATRVTQAPTRSRQRAQV